MIFPEALHYSLFLEVSAIDWFIPGGRNSEVECQLPKLNVVGSIPIARSILSADAARPRATRQRGRASFFVSRDRRLASPSPPCGGRCGR